MNNIEEMDEVSNLQLHRYRQLSDIKGARKFPKHQINHV